MSPLPQPRMTNRRTNARKALRHAALVELPRGVTREATLWDIGLQGLSLMTAKPIAPGTRCTVRFELEPPAEPPALALTAKVVYCSYTGPAAFKVGMVFAALDAASEQAIDDFVRA